jgi:hypothetical protein
LRILPPIVQAVVGAAPLAIFKIVFKFVLLLLLLLLVLVVHNKPLNSNGFEFNILLDVFMIEADGF